MAKTPRLSVPITPEIQRRLRLLCAENGRSLAANLADLAVAGASQTDVTKQLADLKLAFETPAPAARNDGEILREIAAVRAQISQLKPAPTEGESPAVEALFLTEVEARLIFEQVFFAAFLAQEIVGADMPGAERKPGGFYVARAKDKAKLALNNFMNQRGPA